MARRSGMSGAAVAVGTGLGIGGGVVLGMILGNWLFKQNKLRPGEVAMGELPTTTPAPTTAAPETAVTAPTGRAYAYGPYSARR